MFISSNATVRIPHARGAGDVTVGGEREDETKNMKNESFEETREKTQFGT